MARAKHMIRLYSRPHNEVVYLGRAIVTALLCIVCGVCLCAGAIVGWSSAECASQAKGVGLLPLALFSESLAWVKIGSKV